MKNYKYVLTIGTVEIRENIIDIEVLHSVDRGSSAWILLQRSELSTPQMDYLSTAKVYLEDEGDRSVIFTGMIDKIQFEGSLVKVFLCTRIRFLEQQKSGGLVGSPFLTNQEMIWSIFEESRLSWDEVDIPSEWTPSDLETFVVVVPVSGIEVDHPVAVAGVTLTNCIDPIRQMIPEGDKGLRRSFLKKGCWAIIYRTSSSVLAAERDGIRGIQLAMDLLLLTSQVAHNLPLGKLHPYDLSTADARPSLTDTILVASMFSNRGWLRSNQSWVEQPTLHQETLDISSNLAFPEVVPNNLALSINAVARSVTTSDPLESVVGLWDAIEFLASNIVIPPLFTKQEGKLVRANAIKDLTPDQSQRTIKVLEGLNDWSLMAKFERMLDMFSVPTTESDLSVLRSLRRIRNDFTHGRSTNRPSLDDMRKGQAIVTRAIFHIATAIDISLPERTIN